MDKGKEFYHCYQRPKDRGVIFYTVTDHLLYFTIYCTVIKQFRVTPLKLVQMPDHLHHSIMENEHGQLSACLDLITSLFVREYNSAYSREGPMFERRFGRAAKKTDKSIRTNLTYLKIILLKDSLLQGRSAIGGTILLMRSQTIRSQGKSYSERPRCRLDEP